MMEDAQGQEEAASCGRLRTALSGDDIVERCSTNRNVYDMCGR